MRKWLPMTVVLAAAACVCGVSAQGVSTRAMGMANALTSVAAGVETLRFNPAGLAFLPGFQCTAGVGGTAVADTATEFDDLGRKILSGGPDALFFAPQVALVGRHWGASGTCSIRIEDGMATREWTAAGGAGLSLGPLGIGVDVRWIMDDSIQASRMPISAGPVEILKTLFGYALLPGQAADTRLEAGMGAMLQLWSFSLGIYVPDVLSGFQGGSYSSLYEGARAGVSWYPVRFVAKTQVEVFSLLLAADLWNLGSEDRIMRFGAELTMNMVVFGFTARAGYSMGIPGSGTGIPETVTVGLTAHALFVALDAGVETTRAALSALQGGSLLSVPLSKVFAMARVSI